KKSPGVVAVFTAQDFNSVIAGPATHPVAPVFAPEKKTNPPRYPMPKQEGACKSAPVPSVDADARARPAAGAQLLPLESKPVPAGTDLEEARKPGSAKVHPDQPDNIAWDATYVPVEATNEAFKEADVVIKQRIRQDRLSPNPMEPRSVMAEFDSFDNRLTIWM